MLQYINQMQMQFCDLASKLSTMGQSEVFNNISPPAVLPYSYTLVKLSSIQWCLVYKMACFIQGHGAVRNFKK